MKDKTLVYSTEQNFQADIISNKLQESGIACWVLNKQDSSYLAFGHIELRINQEDVDRAKVIIDSH